MQMQKNLFNKNNFLWISFLKERIARRRSGVADAAAESWRSQQFVHFHGRCCCGRFDAGRRRRLFVRLDEKFTCTVVNSQSGAESAVLGRIGRQSSDGSAGSGRSDTGRRRAGSLEEEFGRRRREIDVIAEIVHWLHVQLFQGRGFGVGRTETVPAAVGRRSRLVARRRFAGVFRARLLLFFESLDLDVDFLHVENAVVHDVSVDIRVGAVAQGDVQTVGQIGDATNPLANHLNGLLVLRTSVESACA